MYLDCRETRWEPQGIERGQREKPVQKSKQLTVHFPSDRVKLKKKHVHEEK
jgi:hypothetical protein